MPSVTLCPHCRRSGFTLVEMLVALAVVIILAGLFAATAGKSLNAARAVDCANNQKQVLMAELLYAGDYRGWTPFPFSNYDIGGKSTDLTWSRYLTGGTNRYPIGKTYVTDLAVLRCIDANYSATNDNMQAHTYGKFYYDLLHPETDQEFPGMPFAQWGRTDENGNGFFRYSRMEAPGRFPLFADTVVLDTKGKHYQYYKFNPRTFIKNSDDKAIGVHMRHNGQGIIGFADGRAAALDAGEMLKAGVTHVIDGDFEKQYLQ